jgi:hypothetical protein
MATSIANLGSNYFPTTSFASAPSKAQAPAAPAAAPSMSELATQASDGFESKKAVRTAVDSLIQWAGSVGKTLEPSELEAARKIFIALPEADRAKVVAKLEQLDATTALSRLNPPKPTVTDQVVQFAKSVYGNWAAASLINGSVAASGTLGIAAMFGRGLCCPNVALTMGLLTGVATIGTALKRNLFEE